MQGGNGVLPALGYRVAVALAAMIDQEPDNASHLRGVYCSGGLPGQPPVTSRLFLDNGVAEGAAQRRHGPDWWWRHRGLAKEAECQQGSSITWIVVPGEGDGGPLGTAGFQMCELQRGEGLWSDRAAGCGGTGANTRGTERLPSCLRIQHSHHLPIAHNVVLQAYQCRRPRIWDVCHRLALDLSGSPALPHFAPASADPIWTVILNSIAIFPAVFHLPFVTALPLQYKLHTILERKATPTQSAARDAFASANIVTSFDEVVNNPEIDLVIVSTINDTHYDYTKRSLEAGKHVIVEKPVAPTSQEAKELAKLAKEKNLVLAVCQYDEPNRSTQTGCARADRCLSLDVAS